MAIISISHKPELTKEEAQEIFRRHFQDKYSVQPCDDVPSLKAAFRDFQVVKNPVIGVAFKLEQTGTQTRFIYAAVPPNRWIRTLSMGIAGTVCLFFGRSLTREVEDFIRSAPDFH